MSSITQLREALAGAIARNVPGLDASSQWPTQLNTPVAVVHGPDISFDSDMDSDHYVFPVTVYTGTVDDEAAQTLLDGYCNPRGPSSVRGGLEVDPTLGGVIQYLAVRTMTKYGVHDLQELRCWGAEFAVEVIAFA